MTWENAAAPAVRATPRRWIFVLNAAELGVSGGNDVTVCLDLWPCYSPSDGGALWRYTASPPRSAATAVFRFSAFFAPPTPSTNTQHPLRLHLIIFTLNYNSSIIGQWQQTRACGAFPAKRVVFFFCHGGKISSAAIKKFDAAEKHSAVYLSFG